MISKNLNIYNKNGSSLVYYKKSSFFFLPSTFFYNKKFYLKGEAQTLVKDQSIGYKSMSLDLGSDISYVLKLKKKNIEPNKEYGLFFNNQKKMNLLGGYKKDYIVYKKKNFFKWKLYFCGFLVLNYYSLEKLNKYKFLLDYYSLYNSKIFVFNFFNNNFFSYLPLRKHVRVGLHKYIYYSDFHLEYLKVFKSKLLIFNNNRKYIKSKTTFLIFNFLDYFNRSFSFRSHLTMKRIFFFRHLLYQKHSLWKYRRLKRISKRKRSYSYYVKNNLYVQKSNMLAKERIVRKYFYRTSTLILENE